MKEPTEFRIEGLVIDTRRAVLVVARLLSGPGFLAIEFRRSMDNCNIVGRLGVGVEGGAACAGGTALEGFCTCSRAAICAFKSAIAFWVDSSNCSSLF